MTIARQTRRINRAGGGGGTSWDLSGASLVDNSGDLSGTLRSIFISTDGNHFYTGDFAAGGIEQYSMSTPFDITTLSSVGLYSLANIGGLWFNSDGDVVYFSDINTDTVYRHTLSTAWDISTISASPTSSVYVGGSEGAPVGVDVSDDEKYLIFTGAASDIVFQWEMSTPGDLGTASAYKSISFSGTYAAPYDCRVSTSGETLLVYNASTVYQYTMSTPWDVSTAAYDNVSISPAGTSIVGGVVVSRDDAYIYIVANVQDWVYQYSL